MSKHNEKSIQSKGGNARARILSPEERKAIAAKAAAARWGLPKVICGNPDRPLKIGNIEIPCYVIEGERRVLVQRAIVSAMGMARGGSSKGGGDRLAHFVNQKTLKPFINNEIVTVTAAPLKFLTHTGGVAHGYEAEFLAKLCFSVLDAERAGKLQKQQAHIARQCRILIEGFSVVGINALVDEATGYQELRAKDALAKILEEWIAAETRPYAPIFPLEFYKQIFRLKGWPFTEESIKRGKRPGVVGRYTDDLVYKRLAPGVLDELRRKNPPLNPGRRKHKHFQWLTGDIGDPKLRSHLEGVIKLQKGCSDWDEFKSFVDRFYPIIETTELGIEIEVRKPRIGSK